jgi:uncharacterized protein (DUF1800 family)
MGAPVVSALLVIAIAAPGAAPAPSDDAAIVHVLNRIGYGPRPGDVAKVRGLGIDRFIDQQLHPERLSSRAIDSRLADLETVALSSREIAERYALPALASRRDRRQQQAGAGDQNPPPPRMPNPEQQAANRPLVELSQQKVLRAIYSDRQLEEVLTDFWFNHFNVDTRKGPVRFMATEYERETIRPHVLGRFRDLLGATAKSPAMLFYLDNWMSADPSESAGRPQPRPFGRGGSAGPGRGRRFPGGSTTTRPAPDQQANRMPRGLNENYARELMELHTLGVDGGYTQKDVTEVARAFTGWTIDNPRQGGGFRFEPRRHDDREKTVLGHRIKAGGGLSDGEQVLDLLAAHPSTARFISTKLARRFVSDEPPQPLVDRMAARFTESGGDLREVMRTLLTSQEFLSPRSYAAKVKTPFEFVVSSARATGADVSDARPLVRALQQLGMPLYQCQPPTGYKDTADAWVNTGALVNRMNFAVMLSESRPDLQVGRRAPELKLGPTSTPEDILVGLNVSEATRSTIAKATTPAQAVALTLGSPEFQRR